MSAVREDAGDVASIGRCCHLDLFSFLQIWKTMLLYCFLLWCVVVVRWKLSRMRKGTAHA